LPLRDFARLIKRVLEEDRTEIAFEVFNADGDENNLTKSMIVDLICEQVKSGRVIFRDQGLDRRNYHVSFQKVREQLHFEAQISIRAGIKELVMALNAHLFDNVELESWFYGNYEIDYQTSVGTAK
jgi:nucleoside-diphosphate-sugar epimerase